MKKWLAFGLTTAVSLSLFAGCSNSNGNGNDNTKEPEGSKVENSGEPAEDMTFGVAIYKFDDTFMSGVRSAMQKSADEKNITLNIVDSQNKQPTQNEQVEGFITKGMNALLVNPVDRTAAGPLVDKAKNENVPIVFLNREPEADVMEGYDKTWYVGAKAEQSGTLSGEIISDYWKAHPEMDKNGDGILQYIMITGEPGHQDATLRTKYSVDALKEAGVEVQELATDTAYWDKGKATDLMKTMVAAHGIESIEAVLCNNDDMALGVIETFKAEGYNTGDAAKFIPVVGVDATAPALESMSKGELLGTVLNDGINQGKAAINIANAAASGKEITEANIEYEVTDGKYVWIPYQKVTVDNYKDFMTE